MSDTNLQLLRLQRGTLKQATTCDICGHEDDNLFTNKMLLGCDARLCFCCFSAWYDGNRTTSDEILKESTRLRESGYKRLITL